MSVVTLYHEPFAMRVERGDGVPDLFWLRTRAEWGTRGRNPNFEIRVPLSLVLENGSWLPAACVMYGVEVEMDDAVKDLLEARTQERVALHRILSGDFVAEVALAPARFTRELFDHQQRNLNVLATLLHGADFSVPGAGKTTVLLALHATERQRGRVERLLVVAPLSAFDAWHEEAQACFESAPLRVHVFDGTPIPDDVELLLVNYHRLQGGRRKLIAWMSEAPTHLVLDESHRMKRGRGGQWGARCLDLSPFAARRDILSGTPAPQCTRDLHAQLDFLWPGQAAHLVPGNATDNEVSDIIDNLFVRTTKSELGLKEPTFKVLRVPLEGIHADIYDALSDRYAGSLPFSRRDRLRFLGMNSVVMYMLEAATNPGLLPCGSTQGDSWRWPPLTIPASSTLADLLRSYGRFETPRKFLELNKILMENAAQGRKTLVWTNFTRNLLLLEEMFAVFNPATIHGAIPTAASAPAGATRTRESELHRFRHDDECMVLFANPAATSEGVSLHKCCNDAVYLERTFNACHYLQSVDRIHRLGLDPTKETRVTFLVTENSIDEVVNARVEDKAVRLGRLLEDPDIQAMALPQDSDYHSPNDPTEDLRALLAHLTRDDA